MNIILDMDNSELTSVTEDGVIYAPSVIEINLATQNVEQTDFNGVSVALLTTEGKTLAHAFASENKAVLDTNTKEAVAFVDGYTIDTEKMAFLAIGDSVKPLAIIAVNIKPNPLAEVAPPTAIAPTYPTSESLLAILSQITEQAQQAEQAKTEAQIAEANARTCAGKSQDYSNDSYYYSQQAEKSAKASETNATNASKSASNAEASAKNAQTAEENASNSKALADSYAKSAKGWRNEAEAFRHEALTAKDEAVQTANQVSAQVTNAQAFAKQAQSARGEAMTYALNAQTSASEASQAVADGKREIAIQGETIVGSATEQAGRAEESATQASTSATNAKTSETNAQASAESVSALAEEIEANNNVAKFTAYPNFVKTVCDGIGINYPEASYPLGVVYSMTNGWTIVGMGIASKSSGNANYLCVFDASWTSLHTLKINTRPDLSIFYACAEVDGVAYVFNIDKTYITISVGADGKPIVSEQVATPFAEGLTSARGWNTSNVQVIGRYIVLADVVFDTTAKKVTKILAGRMTRYWRGLLNGVFYANIGSTLVKFSLDANGDIVVGDVNTVSQPNALSLDRTVFGTTYWATLVATNDASYFNYGATFGSNDATYGKRATPSKARTEDILIQCNDAKGVIGITLKGEPFLWQNLNNANSGEDFIIRERILCPASAYALNYAEAKAKIAKAIIHGMDSKGLWMSWSQLIGWVSYHVVQGKLIRVLWEDLK